MYGQYMSVVLLQLGPTISDTVGGSKKTGQ